VKKFFSQGADVADDAMPVPQKATR
jgi:hypothetical protein